MLSRFIICFLLYSVFKVPSLAKQVSPTSRILLEEPVLRFSSKKRKTHFFCFLLLFEPFGSWWAQVDSNHRPHAYQACALTSWAMSPFLVFGFSHLSFQPFGCGGDEQNRTVDPLLARQVLSQLSYAPVFRLKKVVGTGGLEPPTSRLSGVRSNHLSYKPMVKQT